MSRTDATTETIPSQLIRGLHQREIPMLNGLRAIAVLFVVLYHAGLPAPGGFGVLVFFALSGFLITWLLLNEYRKNRDISFRNFYARRSLRIFPAFYAYAALLLGYLVLTHKHINLPQTAAALLYVNDYYQAFQGDPNTGLSHTWSLAVEEQFYLIWAPALLLLLRRRRVLPALVAAILSLWVYRLVLVFSGVPQGYVYEAFDTRADHLLIGCLLAFLLFEKRWMPFVNFCCRTWVIWVNVVALAILNTLEFQYGGLFRNTVAFTVEPVLVAMLIPGLINASEGLAGRVMESPPVSGMGRISYSIYLYQQLTIYPVEKILHGQPVLLQAAASLAVTIAAASLSYWLIEKPFLRLKSRFQAPGKSVPFVRNVTLADSQ